MPPSLAGIHHLKFPVLDIDRSLEWYIRIFDAAHLKQVDHFADGKRYAVILQLPFVMLELRAAESVQPKFDPVTFAVDNRANLDEWMIWLDQNEVKHSPVLTGVVGWVLAFEDPDGRHLRLYTHETHEKTEDTDQDEYWL